VTRPGLVTSVALELPKMRLAMLLVATAALSAGIHSGTPDAEASATADWGGQVHAMCGSAFDPRASREFFPELAGACNAANRHRAAGADSVGPGPIPGKHVSLAHAIAGHPNQQGGRGRNH
jgi:hypothetical protein